VDYALILQAGALSAESALIILLKIRREVWNGTASCNAWELMHCTCTPPHREVHLELSDAKGLPHFGERQRLAKFIDGTVPEANSDNLLHLFVNDDLLKVPTESLLIKRLVVSCRDRPG
jgi:hypothetical protein